MNQYFDLHFHPAFKPYLSDYRPQKRKNCWEKISSPIPFVRSQGSLDQLQEGRVGLAVATFIAIERPMTSSFIIDHLAPLLTVLNKRMLDFPTHANYHERFKEEIDHLIESQEQNPENGQSFKIINSIDDIEEDKLNLLMAIEGGHNLETINATVADNLRKLKQGDQRFLYLTLVHMTQYPLATHAYGMKMIKKNDQFKPTGFGLTEHGKEVIDVAYDESIGPRIFIDIKHMSLVSRVQFYKYRKEKGYDDIPILATHMGVTGISRDPMTIVQYLDGKNLPVRRGDFVEINYEQPRGIGRGMFNKTNFNPWSINLYDEDIIEVLDSGGLIGMNLDQRILGAGKVKGEYFSVQELNYILSGYKDPDNEEDINEGEFSEDEEEEKELNERKHLRHLCNNILHVIKVGGERAWNQLCIGSDFDGLIDPINCCTNATEFPKLEEGLLKMLPHMMEEDETHVYDSSNVEEKVRGIMYDNAFEFLKKHYK